MSVFKIGDKVIGKPDDHKLGVNGINLRLRQKVLTVTEIDIDTFQPEGLLVEVFYQNHCERFFENRLRHFISSVSIEDCM